MLSDFHSGEQSWCLVWNQVSTVFSETIGTWQIILIWRLGEKRKIFDTKCLGPLKYIACEVYHKFVLLQLRLSSQPIRSGPSFFSDLISERGAKWSQHEPHSHCRGTPDQGWLAALQSKQITQSLSTEYTVKSQKLQCILTGLSMDTYYC